VAEQRRAPTDHLTQTPLEELLRLGESAIDAALAEDLRDGDPTSEAMFPDARPLRAVFTAKAPGVIAGLPVADQVFRRVDGAIRLNPHVDEGERVEPGDLLAEVVGPARAILAAERTALNFLQRMSGIATRTAQLGREIATTSASLLDTRKTAPGLRALDKYAVRIGGGTNHRLALSDLAMIKDTHLAAFGSLTEAVSAIRRHAPALGVEIEVRSFEELDEALRIDPVPERILLDNFAPDALKEAVRRVAGRAVTEASGGVSLETIARVAATGVDAISVGEITHSPRALDISMEVRSGSPTIPIAEEIAGIRRRLGDRVTILAHHYTRDAIVRHADIVGDSLALARAATELDAETIVFCGVRFMGEMAAILCRDDQQVVLPVPTAGCFLADCADIGRIEEAWSALGRIVDTSDITPITYVNSSVALKAFCGRNGGTVCTSGNADRVLAWALARTPRVLFFPDRHLASNTALAAGLALDEIAVWPSSDTPDPEYIRRARVIAWPGACDVHRRFRPEDVARIRALHPEASVIVHPECSEAVVDGADRSGSTAVIQTYVESLPSGATVAIGTEARLVRRLQRHHPDKRVLHLAEVPAFCQTMTETTPTALLDVLRRVESGDDVEAMGVAVDPSLVQAARTALRRMLEI
jgi:quinolinate synthase